MRKAFGIRTLAATAAVVIGLTVTTARHRTVFAQAPAAKPVDVKLINYKELGQAVRQHKGKVVVVDLWQIT